MACVPRFLNACNRRIGGPLDADELLDLVQEVQLSVWQKLFEYQGRASLESWVYRFCSLGLLRVLDRNQRRSDRVRFLSTDAFLEESRLPETAAFEQEENLAHHLRHLAPREAEVTRLRFMEDLEFGEIADTLGIDVSSAKTHCYRALEKLRAVLASRAGGSPS